MLPIQDVAPTGRLPIATLGLMLASAVGYWALPMVGWGPVAVVRSLFDHHNTGHWIVSVWFLWLFGDNAEARLGSVATIGVYLLCGLVGLGAMAYLTPGRAMPAIGAAAAVSGVLGAYAVLLPTSRILMLVPAPVPVVEVPAGAFLVMWAAFNVATLLVAARESFLAGLLSLVGAAGLGAIIALVRTRAARPAGYARWAP